jgi:hypothetical protein
VKTGRTLRSGCTHPARWSSLDQVTVRVREGKRTVGRVVVDQETRRQARRPDSRRGQAQAHDRAPASEGRAPG